MKKKNIFKLRYEVMFVPKDGISPTKIFRISLLKFILLFAVAIFLSNVIVVNLLAFTPLHDWLPGFNTVTNEEARQIDELKSKIENIDRELYRVRKINENLNFILQGKPIPIDKRLYDSLYMQQKFYQDSIRYFSKSPLSNNIFFIFNKILTDFFSASLVNADTIKSLGNNLFIFPTVGIISQKFQPKTGHYGIDFSVKSGTSVQASSSGIVIFADYTINDGYKIIIAHPNNYITIYKHLSVLLKKEREKVTIGDVIALSGNSGKHSTASHLHFEIWHNNKPIDPKTICVEINEK
ncbi:MAG: M23 family metallopeptidase [Ignavibacteria bacterium]|nr:M23 family metallopeptidase [Ignavibacteria bacterium]